MVMGPPPSTLGDIHSGVQRTRHLEEGVQNWQHAPFKVSTILTFSYFLKCREAID